MPWIALLAVVGLIGMTTALVGLRGRRVDDHPLCRHCGFDLFGNPQAATCPECGRDLTARRAIRVGHRQRRRGLLVGAAALLVPLLLLAGVGG